MSNKRERALVRATGDKLTLNEPTCGYSGEPLHQCDCVSCNFASFQMQATTNEDADDILPDLELLVENAGQIVVSVPDDDTLPDPPDLTAPTANERAAKGRREFVTVNHQHGLTDAQIKKLKRNAEKMATTNNDDDTLPIPEMVF